MILKQIANLLSYSRPCEMMSANAKMMLCLITCVCVHVSRKMPPVCVWVCVFGCVIKSARKSWHLKSFSLFRVGILKTSLRGIGHWNIPGRGGSTGGRKGKAMTHINTHAHTVTLRAGWSVWTGNGRLSCQSSQTDSEGSAISGLQTFSAIFPAPLRKSALCLRHPGDIAHLLPQQNTSVTLYEGGRVYM